MRNLEHTLGAPWHHKQIKDEHNQPVDIIHNIHGRELFELRHPGGEHYTAHQYRIIRNSIQHHPQLVAALVECVFHLDMLGHPPTGRLAELIHLAGGPDLANRVDNESETKSSS